MTTTEQVYEYVEHVFEPDDWVELRAIDANKRIRKFWKQARDLTNLIPDLQRLNEDGFNIYIGPNPRLGPGLSGDKNVTVFRCLFADFDGIEPGDGCGIYEFVEWGIADARLPEPTLTIMSGHGCHAYWRMAQPVPPEQWKIIQKRLIVTLNSDPACSNPERLLRLPGFLNHKRLPVTECFRLYMEAR